jgi:hypothetical protein
MTPDAAVDGGMPDGAAYQPDRGPAVEAPIVSLLDAPSRADVIFDNVDSEPPEDATIDAVDGAPFADVRIGPTDSAPPADVTIGAVDSAPPADVDGRPNDDGGCVGMLCDDFAGDNPDAGLPTGFATVNPGTATWTVVADGLNKLFEGEQTGGGAEYVEAGVATWTDQTIQVKLRFASVIGGSARICGRFTSTDATYCLDISTPGTGSNPGCMYILKRQTGGSATLGSIVFDLPIRAGVWHSFRFSISGSSTVHLNAFLDGASTAIVSATDNSSPYTAGAVALGVYNLVTADFDDLLVTTP